MKLIFMFMLPFALAMEPEPKPPPTVADYMFDEDGQMLPEYGIGFRTWAEAKAAMCKCGRAAEPETEPEAEPKSDQKPEAQPARHRRKKFAPKKMKMDDEASLPPFQYPN
eukprot:SAG11_NODE_615_length_8197_cov_4.551426_5_plen_110_part_00